MRLKSKLLFVNIPSDDPPAAAGFYSAMFGIELTRSLTDQTVSYHAPIDEDGIDLTVSARQYPDEMATAFFGVADLDDAIRRLEQAGGKVVAGPFDLPVADRLYEEYKKNQEDELKGRPDARDEKVERSLGRSVVVVDQGGVPFGLTELTRHAERHFNFGRQQRELRGEQVRVHDRAKKLGQRMDELEPA